MPNDDGQTRRDRNESADEYTADFIIPESGQFLWEIYETIARGISRSGDGGYSLIPPTEFEAWCRLTGTLVYPHEYDILVAMDRVYCEEANKELEAQREARLEEQRREAERNRRG